MTCSEGDLNENFGISPEAWGDDYAAVLPGEETYIPPKPLVMLAKQVVDRDILTLPLGLNDHGQSIGVLAIDPDVASNVPLSVDDVDRHVKFLADLTTVERIVVSSSLHQIVTPSLLFSVEELVGGDLSLQSYSIDDVTYDENLQHYFVDPSALAQTALTVSRMENDPSAGGLPSITFTGTVRGVPYHAVHARIAEEGVGSISEVIENGSKRVTVDHFTEDPASASGYSRTRAVSDYRNTSLSAEWVLISRKMVTTRTLLNGREVAIREEAVTADKSVVTTHFVYDELFVVGGSLNKAYGKLLSREDSNGNWVTNDYDSEGRIWRIRRPWLSTPAIKDDATSENCLERTFTYFDATDLWIGQNLERTRVLGTVVAETTTSVTTEGDFLVHTKEEKDFRLNSSGQVISSPAVTVRYYETLPNNRHRLMKTLAPNGFMSRSVSQRGVVDENVFTADEDGTWTQDVDYRQLAANGTAVAGLTQRTVSWRDNLGKTVRVVNAVAQQSGAVDSISFLVVEGRLTEYDPQGRPMRERLLMGEIEREWSHARNGTASTVTTMDRSGLSTVQFSDSNTGVSISEQAGGALAEGHGLIMPEHVGDGSYQLAGQRTSRFTFAGPPLVANPPGDDDPPEGDDPPSPYDPLAITGQFGSLMEITVTQGVDNLGSPEYRSQTTIREPTGRPVYQIDNNGLVTAYAYADAGRTEIITMPGGATRATVLHLDGQLQSVTGTGVVPQFVTRQVNADGTLSETTHIGSSDSPRWKKVTRTMAGRVLFEEAPSPENPNEVAVTRYFHDEAGRLIRVSRPGTADQISVYENRRLVRQGLDLDGNGQLNLVGPDQVTTLQHSYRQVAGVWQEVTTQTMLTENASGELGLVTERWNEVGRGQLARRGQLIAGSSTVTTTNCGVGSAHRTVTHVTTRPDQSTHTIQEHYVAGKLAARVDTALGTTSWFLYDSLGRLTASSDPARHGGQGLLESRSYNGDRLASSSSESGRRTHYAYYPAEHPNAGRVAETWIWEGINKSSQVFFEYDSHGRETRRHGPGSYPIEKTYDEYGQLHQMKTWRSEAADPDITTWLYHPATGLLISKTDANNRSVSYTYDAAGRVKTRTWARNLITTYSYTPAGALSGVIYSDDTPPVTHLYDRAGRPVETQDGSGTRVISQTSANGIPNPAELGYAYTAGPLAGWQVSQPQDAAGRVAGWRVKLNGAVRASSNWAYAEGSPHLESVSLGQHRATYQRETAPYLNGLPSGIQYTGAGVHLERWVNGEGQRAGMTMRYSPAAEPVFGEHLLFQQTQLNSHGTQSSSTRHWTGWTGSVLNYRYNEREEVEGATERNSVGMVDVGELLPGRGFRYAYDAIGNRTAASVSTLGSTVADWENAQNGSAQTTGYSDTNELNQYEVIQRPNPLLRLVQGFAHPEATVEITLSGGDAGETVSQTLRWGPGLAAYAAQAAITLNTQAGWRRVFIRASRSGLGAGGETLSITRDGWLFFPPVNETLSYDLNGNLTADARWTYGWDGDNRLIWMEEKPIAGTGPRLPRQRLEYDYDSQSRRIAKRVLRKTHELGDWSLHQHRMFLYDGWNMIGELEVSISSGAARLHRSYAWGLDASGTLTGAGGVGGLLLTTHYGTAGSGNVTLAPLYDFNSNVLVYVDVTTSILTHRIDYDPFGNELTLDTLLPTEAAAEAPRFRFSTKYTDSESGLVYYGFRSYSPELGRWPSRDPIEERGGLNLYGMVGNDAVNRVDYLGLLPQACYRPMVTFDWMGPLAPIWHAFVRFSDGTTESNLGREPRGYKSSYTVCFPGELRNDFGAKLSTNGTPCECASEDEIEDCVRKKIRSLSVSGVLSWSNNCGSIVRDAFLDCCLKDPTPSIIYYPGGTNSDGPRPPLRPSNDYVPHDWGVGP